MSCPFCGMPPLDGQGCCTGTFRADTMRRTDKRLARAIQLLSAAHMMLEAAEYRDSENAIAALDTRQQIDAFLPKDALR